MPLNLPCFALCCEVCEGLFWETGIGVILCIIGCKIACDTDTLQADNEPGPDSPYGGGKTGFITDADTIQVTIVPEINSFSTVSIPGGTRYTASVTSTDQFGSTRVDTIQRDVVGNVRTISITTVSTNPYANPTTKTHSVQIAVTKGTVGSDGKLAMSSVVNGSYNHSSRVAPVAGGDSSSASNQDNLLAAFRAKGLSS